MGYAWLPIFKIEPASGPTETYDLTSVLSDLSGPEKIDAAHLPEMDGWEDVNFDKGTYVKGFRRTVKFLMSIFNMDDQAAIRRVVEALADGSSVVSLSMDDGDEFFPV